MCSALRSAVANAVARLQFSLLFNIYRRFAGLNGCGADQVTKRKKNSALSLSSRSSAPHSQPQPPNSFALSSHPPLLPTVRVSRFSYASSTSCLGARRRSNCSSPPVVFPFFFLSRRHSCSPGGEQGGPCFSSPTLIFFHLFFLIPLCFELPYLHHRAQHTLKS